MAFRRVVRWAVDEAGNVIGGTGYEGRLYVANSSTLGTLKLDSAGSFACANPHSPNPGTQTSSSANMLTTDDTIAVLSSTGFTVADLVPIDGSAGRFYGVIRTIVDATHIQFTQTLAAMGGAATMNSGALVGGPEMTGHWQAFVQDTSDYDFTLKNLATGKEGPPEGVATLSTAGTLIFQEEGVDTSTRPKLNFIGPLVTLTDNAGQNRGDVTIATPTAPGASAVGDTQSTGTTTTVAAADHRHAREAFVTNTVALGTAAGAGVATTLIRSDATIAAFDATNPAASAVGDTAVVGVINFAARRDHRHAREASGITVLDKKVTDTSVTNTLTETDIYRKTITGNTIGANGVLRFVLSGQINNNGTTGTSRYRVKFGGTTLFDTLASSNIASSTTAHFWALELWIWNAASTGAQRAMARLTITDFNGGGAAFVLMGNGGLVDLIAGPTDATSSEDTTASKDLAVTVQHGTAATTYTTVSKEGMLELLT